MSATSRLAALPAQRGIDLSGRVALVTGTSRGIGAAIARDLAAYGARVACASRDRADSEDLVHDIECAGGQAFAVGLDVRREESAARAVDAALEVWGRLAALGRVGSPQELASVVSFLCCDLASFVTGAVLTVDGGLTVQFGLQETA